MMQFMPATAARFGLSNPHDTAAAIHAAARYVRFLSERFNNRFELVLAGYNAGEGAVDAYLHGIALRTSDGRIINPNRISTGGVPPVAETRSYVARGLQIMNAVAESNVFTTTDLAAARPLLVPAVQGIYQQQESASIADSGFSLLSPPQTADAPQRNVAPISRYAVSNMSQHLDGEESSTADDFSLTNIRPRSFRVSAATILDAPPPHQRSVRAQK
jgi:hypothetical protein